MFSHADQRTILYKAAGQKKGFKIKRHAQKKPLVEQRPWGINEPGGMLSRNGQAYDVLAPVRVVLPVRFPAVPVR